MADDRAKPGAASTSGRLPGDALLHPVSLAALGLLLVNDHVLKASFLGPITGKLSDVAGAILTCTPSSAWTTRPARRPAGAV